MRCPYYTGVRKAGFDCTFQPDLPVNNQILTFPFVSIFASSLPVCFVSSSSEVFSRLPSSWSRCDSLEPASETVSSPSVVSSSFLCLPAFSGWDVVFENQLDVDFLELLEANEYDVYCKYRIQNGYQERKCRLKWGLKPRPPGNLSRVWQPLHRQNYHTGNAAVEKKRDLCRLEYRLLNIK